MDDIRSSVIACLGESAGDEAKLISELNRLAAEHGGKTYPVILHVLTHLSFNETEAREYWKQIIDHRNGMSSTLGREVNLRTAICDFFCSINKSLHNPKVIEIHIFEETALQSKYDSLTTLLNRRSFDEALALEFARADRHEQAFSILFLDLDDFKKLNDSAGHLVGDEALKAVASIVKIEKRTEDIAARYGGEEMVLILPKTDRKEATVVAERIRAKIEALRIPHDGKMLRITLSGGISTFPHDAQSAADLLEFADKALYEAKLCGKNMIIPFTPHNRRRDYRKNFPGHVRVEALGVVSIVNAAAKGRNLSLNGMLFESDCPLKLGDKLNLTVPLEPGKEPLQLMGVVVRVEPSNPGQYSIGVNFMDADKEGKKAIARFLAGRFIPALN